MANFNLQKFDYLDSTSAKAKELAAAGAAPWTVVLAEKQGAGYGCKGNKWFSPEGGLYFSVVLPKGDIDDLQIITILSAFCVADAIKNNFAVEPMIKLPNDVYLNGKKISGAITENVFSGQVKYSVIGIGVNTNVQPIPGPIAGVATSLKIELDRRIDNNLILGQIITQLQNIFKSISQ